MKVPKPVPWRDPAFVAWVSGQSCVVCGRPGDAAHLRTKRVHGDRENVVPLCREHHVEQHQGGIVAFSLRYRVNLWALAREWWRAWEARCSS